MMGSATNTYGTTLEEKKMNASNIPTDYALGLFTLNFL